MLWDESGDIRELYKIKQLPSTISIDKQGMIRDEKAGGPIEDWDRLANRIDTLNDEKSDFSSI